MRTSLPTKDHFQVGWICALPIERLAARSMLDEEFDIRIPQEASDSNAYLFGRVHDHLVVIASLPFASYGTTAAAVVATNMQRTFSSSLRLRLLVGIAGGIPSKENDVRLGDIVVGANQSSGGVVQYDFKKDLADGTSQRIGHVNRPPTSLLTSIGALIESHDFGTPKYESYIQMVVACSKDSSHSKFSRPPPENDRLFAADYLHMDDKMDCSQCQKSFQIERPVRLTTAPRIFYGTIASGNTLMKNAKERDRIGEQTQALCLEMEGAGLANDFPCLVVKGISDYCDSHKNKDWQGFAAIAAAAYAKELLFYVPLVSIHAIPPVPDSTLRTLSFQVLCSSVGQCTIASNAICYPCAIQVWDLSSTRLLFHNIRHVQFWILT